MEAGTHSIWISEQIRDLGHEVIVANVRKLRAISHSDRQSDSVDAEKLARYLGLRPKRSQSGGRDPHLGITKAGNGYLRQLLVECANHVIGPHGKDSTLRRWGLSLGAHGGSHARRRAVVAVARKLAVLLHRIWITQEAYVPFHAATV